MLPADFSERPVRLACYECDRDDHDFITEAELVQAEANGWGCIEEVQTLEESLKVYELHETPPPGYSVLDWYTHVGTCPDCLKRKEDVTC